MLKLLYLTVRRPTEDFLIEEPQHLGREVPAIERVDSLAQSAVGSARLTR